MRQTLHRRGPASTFDKPATPGLLAFRSPGFPTGDPSSFVSGDFSVNTFFLLGIPDLGLAIYSDPAVPAVFTAALTGLPPPEGTILTSPDPVNLFLQVGDEIDPASDLLIGESFARTVTVTSTPEPSTILMLATAGVVALGARRFRILDIGFRK